VNDTAVVPQRECLRSHRNLKTEPQLAAADAHI